jgi:hypothetical protein
VTTPRPPGVNRAVSAGCTSPSAPIARTGPLSYVLGYAPSATLGSGTWLFQLAAFLRAT